MQYSELPCLICKEFLNDQDILLKTFGGFGSRILDMSGVLWLGICQKCILSRRSLLLVKIGSTNEILNGKDVSLNLIGESSTISAKTLASPTEPFPCLICQKQLEAASYSSQVNAYLVVDHKYGVWNGISFNFSNSFIRKSPEIGSTGVASKALISNFQEVWFIICDTCLLQRRNRFVGRRFKNDNVAVPGLRSTKFSEIVWGPEYFKEWISWFTSRIKYPKDDDDLMDALYYYHNYVEPGEQLV